MSSPPQPKLVGDTFDGLARVMHAEHVWFMYFLLSARAICASCALFVATFVGSVSTLLLTHFQSILEKTNKQKRVHDVQAMVQAPSVQAAVHA
jgi:hypothetical protein